MGSRVAAVLRDPVTLIVGSLAVHRVTRFVTRDELPAPLRDRVLDARPEGRLAYLLTCPWCVSPYVAAAFAALTVAAPEVALPVGVVLAWSSAAGLLSATE